MLFLHLRIKKVVGSSGLEPPTSRLSGARSNHLSYEPMLPKIRRGGDEEARTPDPLLAKQVLSQLSYTPMSLNTGLITVALPFALKSHCWALKIKQYWLPERT